MTKEIFEHFGHMIRTGIGGFIFDPSIMADNNLKDHILAGLVCLFFCWMLTMLHVFDTLTQLFRKVKLTSKNKSHESSSKLTA